MRLPSGTSAKPASTTRCGATPLIDLPSMRISPEQGTRPAIALQQRALAGAVGAENHHDLAGRDLERCVVQRFMPPIAHRQAAALKHGLLRDRRERLPCAVSASLGRAFGDFHAAVHHHAAVAQASDRVHDVLDQHDGPAFLAQAVNHADPELHLGGVEPRQPFVQQQDARVGGKRAGELDRVSRRCTSATPSARRPRGSCPRGRVAAARNPGLRRPTGAYGRIPRRPRRSRAR